MSISSRNVSSDTVFNPRHMIWEQGSLDLSTRLRASRLTSRIFEARGLRPDRSAARVQIKRIVPVGQSTRLSLQKSVCSPSLYVVERRNDQQGVHTSSSKGKALERTVRSRGPRIWKHWPLPDRDQFWVRVRDSDGKVGGIIMLEGMKVQCSSV